MYRFNILLEITMKKIFLTAVLILTASSTFADTHNANCTQASIEAAITASQDGDTVAIGNGSCTFTSQVTVTKAITIMGNSTPSITNTLLTNSGGIFVFEMDQNTASKKWRINGSTFKGDAGVQITGSSKYSSAGGWRIDNCRFDNMTNCGIEVNGPTFGVIDHCTFYSSAGGNFTGVYIFGGPSVSDAGNTSWATGLTIGTADAVFIEDCTFTRVGSIGPKGYFDGRNGARVVFRYNTVTEWFSYVHDAQTGQTRGWMQTEMYNNTFQPDPTNGYSRAIWIKGGTGIIYDNTFYETGGGFSQNSPVLIGNYRSCVSGNPPGDPWDGWCNGTFTEKFCSNSNTYPRNCTQDSDCGTGGVCTQVDGNQSGKNGYPCRDQIGWTGGAVQTSSPMYFWNNIWTKAGKGNVTPDINSGGSCDIDYHPNHIKIGRDVFVATDKTDAISKGLNTYYPNYASYTYPHPLSRPSQSPSPPTNLRIIQQ